MPTEKAGGVVPVTIDRRAFMTGVASVAVAAALPATPEPFIGLDLAAPGSERAAVVFFESTAGNPYSFWFEYMKELEAEIQRVTGISEEYLRRGR